MSVVEEQVEVAVPVRTAYNQWTQVQSFPDFMEGVQRVDQLTDTTVHWVADGGEFDAVIEHRVPDEGISWRVVDGPKYDGTVSLTALSDGRTQVSLRIESDGEAPGGRVLGDLRRFKELVEAQSSDTAEWRGETRIDPDHTQGL